jgi:uncharacterized protein (DUF983 family)
MNADTLKSSGSIAGIVGTCASGTSALVFVLRDSLAQTLWFVLVGLTLLGLFTTAIATWKQSRWWLLGLFFSLLLILALVGAIA